MKIVGFIKIDEGIGMDAECLNRAFDITINGVQGKLLTPSLPEDFVEKETCMFVKLIEPDSQIRILQDNFSWGSPVHWPSGDSVVEAFKVEFEYGDSLEVKQMGTTISKGMEEWINRFRENLFAFDYNIDHPKSRYNWPVLTDYNLYYQAGTGAKPDRAFDHVYPVIHLELRKGLILEEFQNTLDATSGNMELILEYKLLKEADTALLAKDYRKTILDCASALELSFTNAIRRMYNGDAGSLDRVLSKKTGLAKRRKLLKKLGQELPEHDYANEIELIRNRAIHVGKTPTDKEVKNAYDIVNEVLDLLSIEKLKPIQT